MSNEPIPLTSGDYETLLPLVTAERLGSYARVTHGGTADAFRLYEWNMRAAANVIELTSMVEVITRNALDTQLREWAKRKHGDDSWLDVAPSTTRGARIFIKLEIGRRVTGKGLRIMVAS